MRASPSETAAASDSAQQRAAIGVSFGSFMLLGLSDGGFGVVLPSLMGFYGISRGTAGLLFLALNAGYIPSVLASGPLYERLGRRRCQTLGGALFAAATVACGTAPPFAGLAMAFVGLGFAFGTVDAGLNAYVAALPGSAGLLNYVHGFYGLGALLAPAIASGLLARGSGWNVVYLCWAAVGALVAIGSAKAFPASRPSHADTAGPEGLGLLSRALRLPTVRLAALTLLLYVGAEASLGTWAFSLLREDHGIALLVAGWMVSGYWAGLTLGRFVLGRFAADLGAFRLGLLCFAGLAVGLAVLWAGRPAALAAVGLFLAGFALGPIFPTTISLLSDRVSARLQQAAIGFAVSLGSVGAATFPWLAGNLTQAVGLWALIPFVLTLAGLTASLWPRLTRATRAMQPA